MSYTETIRYEQIKQSARKNLPCPLCGKKVRRQATFSMTLNPWNKNPDGSVRTARDIAAALQVQADTWSALPELHSACREIAEGAT